MELASGGMAEVHVARHVGGAGFERMVVVKRVHRHLLQSRDFYDMFREEARVASTIHHPNVVPVVDVVEAEGELFLVLEYVDSATLATLLRVLSVQGWLLPAPVISRIVLDALAGLGAAHEAVDLAGQPMEIVHRDVSPQNIIVDVGGMTRLIDFGIAKAAHRICQTRAGQLKGKTSFMSPEQARGEALDPRSDLFSLGIVLHEALTGERLFAAETAYESLLRIVSADVAPPSAHRDDVPPELDRVVAKALARDRQERFQTADEFAEALAGACPPATHKDVAAFIEYCVGDRLRQRRTKLRALAATSGPRVIDAAARMERDPTEAMPTPHTARWSLAPLAKAVSAIAIAAVFVMFAWTRPPSPARWMRAPRAVVYPSTVVIERPPEEEPRKSAPPKPAPKQARAPTLEIHLSR
jgi:serine/threonine protein kinase